MNVDEALLFADGISPTALGGKGALSVLVLLAAEVRRQHAEIERWQSNFDAERAQLQAANGEIERLRPMVEGMKP